MKYKPSYDRKPKLNHMTALAGLINARNSSRA